MTDAPRELEVELNEYVTQTLETFLEPLVCELLHARSPDPRAKLIELICPDMPRLIEENDGLHQKVSALELEKTKYMKKLHEYEKAANPDDASDASSLDLSSTDSENETDHEREAALAMAPSGGARKSVSAEAYGEYNKKVAFIPPVIPKSKEQSDEISKTLESVAMLQQLEPEERKIIVDAVSIVPYDKGDYLIREGDDGDCLYILFKGNCEVIKKFEDGEKKVKEYESGDVFGELALLYNVKRAASVLASSSVVTLRLDRNTFNAVVKDAAVAKREEYSSFLKKVPILSSIDAYQISQIVDAVRRVNYDEGTTLCKQGEQGDVFFLLKEGQCHATKTSETGEEEKVMEYDAGDYFGELALIRSQPRAATIWATTNVTVLTIDRKSFNRLIGALTDIETKTKDYK